MTKMEEKIKSLELEIKITDCKEEQLRNEYYDKKASREVALVRRQKAAEQGLQTDHIFVPPAPVFPSKELRKLRYSSAKQAIKLAKLQQSNDPEKVPLCPNYVDLMISWSNIMQELWGLAIIVGLSITLAAGQPGFTGLCVSAAIFGAAWLPGIITSAFLPNACKAIGEVDSAYRDARGVFGYGSKIGWERFRHIGGIDSAVTLVMLFLITATIIGLVCGIFNASALIMALVAGVFLSWGGAIMVIVILVHDAIRVRRKIRRVF